MRKPRILTEGARYHVSARANRQDLIFSEDETKDLFLSVVRKAKSRFDFRIENFCIMGNHIHFIIRPGRGESLSSIMQWVLGVFAMRFNHLRHLTGHVWGERFFSKIIENIRAYHETFSYIDANPLIAGLVDRVEDWLYGRFHVRAIGFEDILANPASWADWP
jgi:putative transposase